MKARKGADRGNGRMTEDAGGGATKETKGEGTRSKGGDTHEKEGDNKSITKSNEGGNTEEKEGGSTESKQGGNNEEKEGDNTQKDEEGITGEKEEDNTQKNKEGSTEEKEGDNTQEKEGGSTEEKEHNTQEKEGGITESKEGDNTEENKGGNGGGDHDLASGQPQNQKGPFDHYMGGVSQHREDEEWLWDQWDWPPQGWRPNTWQTCYWDNKNKYYGYHDYDWQRTPESQIRRNNTPPEIWSNGEQSQSSIELEKISDVLKRANTGDIRAPSPRVMETAFKAAAEETKQDTQGKDRDMNDEANNSKPKQDPLAVKSNEQQTQKEEKDSKKKENQDNENKENAPPKETENKENAPPKKTENMENAPPNEKEPEKEKEKANEKEQKDEKERNPEVDKAQAALEKRRREAHARYMRYYRSIRSQVLGFLFLKLLMPMDLLCLHFLGPSTPIELRTMGKEANGSTLTLLR